jgi:hypothetical protein
MAWGILQDIRHCLTLMHSYWNWLRLLIRYGHACKLQYLHMEIFRLHVEHFGAYTSIKDFTVYSLDYTDCSDKQCGYCVAK